MPRRIYLRGSGWLPYGKCVKDKTSTQDNNKQPGQDGSTDDNNKQPGQDGATEDAQSDASSDENSNLCEFKDQNRRRPCYKTNILALARELKSAMALHGTVVLPNMPALKCAMALITTATAAAMKIFLVLAITALLAATTARRAWMPKVKTKMRFPVVLRARLLPKTNATKPSASSPISMLMAF